MAVQINRYIGSLDRTYRAILKWLGDDFENLLEK
jgi:hypothetical protein